MTDFASSAHQARTFINGPQFGADTYESLVQNNLDSYLESIRFDTPGAENSAEAATTVDIAGEVRDYLGVLVSTTRILEAEVVSGTAATGATLTETEATDVISGSASKRIVFRTDATGQFTLRITDASDGTVKVRVKHRTGFPRVDLATAQKIVTFIPVP